MPHTPVQPLIAIAGVGAFPVASISSTVLDGSLWLSIPLAALAGFISFASPCVLPLVPGYLGYVAGLTGANIPATGASQAEGHAAEPVDAKTFALVNPAAARRLASTVPQTQDVVDNHSASAPITAESKAQTPNEYAVTRRKATWRLLAGVALFIAGFSAIFVLLSVVLAQLGAAPWLKGQSWVTMILGALVVLMGIVFLGGLSIFQTDKRLHRRPVTGLWGAPILGITFGLGWAPCIGPTFAAVQTLVYTGGSGTGKAVVLTLAYCLGLGVPFLLVAWGMGRGVSTLAWAQKHRLGIQRVGGAVLILIGVLLMTGLWTDLMSWIQAALPAYELPI